MLSLPAVALGRRQADEAFSRQLAQAVNLAVNDHIPLGQTRAQTLSDWKGIADAEAARNAVFAAMLARAGPHRSGADLRRPLGLLRSLSAGPADVDVGAFGRRGVAFRIHQCGLKSYPAHITAQTAIPAAVALAKEIGNLDRIAAHRDRHHPPRLSDRRQRPREMGAGYQGDGGSQPALYHGAGHVRRRPSTTTAIAPEKLHDPRILAFMRKITVKEDPAFATLTGNVPPTRLTATLDDGRRITRLSTTCPASPASR